MSHFLSCLCTVTVYPHALLSAQQRSLVSDSALLPVTQHHTFSVLFLLPDLVTFFFFFFFQDPAGIFELVEVVGNGTYGQVYKVSTPMMLFCPFIRHLLHASVPC